MPKVIISYPVTGEHLHALRSCAQGWRIVCVESEEEARHEIADAEVFLGNPFFLQSLPFAKKLKWMQSNSVGMDLLLSSRLMQDSSFILSNARGVYDDEVADHALALALGLLRAFPRTMHDRLRERWERYPLERIADLPTLVFGYGGIGRAICRRLEAFQTPYKIVRRNRQSTTLSEKRMPPVFLSPQRGIEALNETRMVFLALPLTSETRTLFDANVLARLPDGAYIVNISRGELIDEHALRNELERLNGFGTDVFENEPLPKGHWAWHHPKVLFTPHVARAPEGGRRRFFSLFEENLRRWVKGQPLKNVVDKNAGYR